MIIDIFHKMFCVTTMIGIMLFQRDVHRIEHDSEKI